MVLVVHHLHDSRVAAFLYCSNHLNLRLVALLPRLYVLLHHHLRFFQLPRHNHARQDSTASDRDHHLRRLHHHWAFRDRHHRYLHRPLYYCLERLRCLHSSVIWPMHRCTRRKKKRSNHDWASRYTRNDFENQCVHDLAVGSLNRVAFSWFRVLLEPLTTLAEDLP